MEIILTNHGKKRLDQRNIKNPNDVSLKVAKGKVLNKIKAKEKSRKNDNDKVYYFYYLLYKNSKATLIALYICRKIGVGKKYKLVTAYKMKV